MSNEQRDVEPAKSLGSFKITQSQQVGEFQRKLLKWFAQNGRDLPWRHTRDPYRILVSEMMLHQTQVARVVEKYCEWIAAYPTFEALASAPLEEVKERWRPLGYNYRPERLHQIAKHVVNELSGRLPNNADKLMALRGIGRYTAGAILSFAFHQDAPIVDTNVRRIINRIFGSPSDLPRTFSDRETWQLAAALIPTGQAHVFNQALMDFGALECTARRPKCSSCLAEEFCTWKQARLFPR